MVIRAGRGMPAGPGGRPLGPLLDDWRHRIDQRGDDSSAQIREAWRTGSLCGQREREARRRETVELFVTLADG
ncbi:MULTISPECIES: hypothetical protein [Kitasatospora]|uniref:Uncharacterized protein n=1 Tax=Kitasatospora setae (strain ATCC 33774 / DSM 43861 / JCM 3304 / KCC A-0304 / NBRC 14216 / KM-6054) TaxID=452652 RepID=E4NAL4_KITSK|nr:MULTISPECIES: hypothetical protein [Kitasatospora]BAJ28245.1 hypothetical protein KSE_24280 [Kitasatospora setae KM-6054]